MLSLFALVDLQCSLGNALVGLLSIANFVKTQHLLYIFVVVWDILG